MSDVTMQDDGGVLASYQSHTDPFNSLELRGELLLKKMSMAINNSHLSMHTNKGAEAAASSNCFPRSAYSLQTRPLFSEKKGEVNVSPSLSNSIGSTSPTSTRTISSDDLAFNEFQFVAQGQQLQPQQQHLDQNQLGLEPSDFRQINSLHSSSLLDLLFGNEEIFSADENANAKSIKNEFRSKLQEQTMLQEHLRQLGQSQMQQFGQQPALLLQQLQQQQQQQRLLQWAEILKIIFLFAPTLLLNHVLQTRPVQRTRIQINALKQFRRPVWSKNLFPIVVLNQ